MITKIIIKRVYQGPLIHEKNRYDKELPYNTIYFHIIYIIPILDIIPKLYIISVLYIIPKLYIIPILYINPILYIIPILYKIPILYNSSIYFHTVAIINRKYQINTHVLSPSVFLNSTGHMPLVIMAIVPVTYHCSGRSTWYRRSNIHFNSYPAVSLIESTAIGSQLTCEVYR